MPHFHSTLSSTGRPGPLAPRTSSGCRKPPGKLSFGGHTSQKPGALWPLCMDSSVPMLCWTCQQLSVLTPDDKHPSVGTVVEWAADSGSFPAHEQLCNYIFMLLELTQLDLCGSFQRPAFAPRELPCQRGRGTRGRPGKPIPSPKCKLSYLEMMGNEERQG